MKLLLSEERALLARWKLRHSGMPDYDDAHRAIRRNMGTMITELEVLIQQQESRSL